MGKIIRILIALSLVLGIVLLAQDQVARANRSSDQSLSAENQDVQSVLLAPGDDDCKKDKNKNKDKCKGTVKPPPPGIVIPVTGAGTYAVGGVCTVTVEYKADGLSDEVSLEVPVEKSRSVPFPVSDGKIHLPGCHVLHYQFEQIKSEMTPADGSWTICFAARPNKTMTIYYYLDDLETVVPIWIPLETTVESGIACAPAYYSGVYAPASK